MEPFGVLHTELPHTSKLFADFIYDFGRIAAFFDQNPADSQAYQAAANRIEFPETRRTALISALKEHNADNPQLELLAQPGTVAVVTGQQVGLFSGPCYTIYKALTAAKLARELTSRGIPAVGIFWLATEDHDSDEVNHCWTFGIEHQPLALRIETGAFPEKPAGDIPLVNPPLGELRTTLSTFLHGDEIAALAEESYSPGQTMGSAFRALLERLLGPYGLLFVDPMQPAFREMAAPMLRNAVETAPELIRHLLDRNRALEANGYHSQVHVDAHSSLLFLLDKGRRIALRRREGGYRAGNNRISQDELLAEPERLSPNALLRPIVQDYVLPTVACIAGPGEVAYFAQSHVLYKALLGRAPVVVPRSGFTVLDARAVKLMNRYGLTLQSFFLGADKFKRYIAEKLVPPELNEEFRAATVSVSGEVDKLRGVLTAFDPTLAGALDKSRTKILYQLSKIERKTALESMRRDQRASAEADYLYNLVYPNGHLQERFYTILPLLAKHGLDFIQQLYENVLLDCPDHIVIAA